MAVKNIAQIKFELQAQQFNSGMKSVNANMTAMRAALALNEAQFKNSGNAAEYLENKQRILSEQLEYSKTKQELLNNRLQDAKAAYGENSTEATQWATKLDRAKIEQEKLRTAINETEAAIDAQASEADAAEKQLDELAAAEKNAGDAAEEAGGSWSGAQQILANLGTQTINAIIDRIQDAAKAVVNLGKDFTASLSNVQALSGATASEMSRLEETAKALGRSTIFSAKDVSDAFGYMALAGWDVQDMLDGVDGVLNLAASAQMDLAKASDIVTDYLTAFGLGAEDSGKFVDQMAYAMANSNTNVEQLGEAYKNVAATAGSLGYSVEETTAALMTMANAGVKGGEAGTGLSAIMTRLATDTKGCAKELSKYGVEVYDSRGNMQSLGSILNGIAGIWGDLTDQEQANLAKIIAGQSQYSKFQTVMAGLSESAEESGQSFNDYTEALEACEGAASNMSDVMQDNLQGDLAALNSAAEGLGLALYDYFDGALRGAAQVATELLNGITDAITPQRSELQGFLDEITAANEQVQKSLANAESAMSGATEHIGELEAYKDILLDLNSKTELTEFEQYQLKTAVEELSGSIPGLADAFDSTNGTLTVTNEQLVEMFNNAEQLALQQALIEAQAESYKALAEAKIQQAKANSAVNVAQEQLNDLMERNAAAIEETGQGLSSYDKELTQATYELNQAQGAQMDATSAMETAQAQIDEENAAFETLREEAGLSAESISELKTETEEAGKAAQETAGDVSEASQLTQEEIEAAKERAKELKEAYEELRDGVKDSMKSSVSFMQEFSGGAKITADEMLANLQSQREGLANWSANMQTLAGEVGNGMTQEMYDALLEMGPSSANAVQELVNTLESDRGKFEEISNTWAEAMSISDDGTMLASYTAVGKNAAAAIGEGLDSGAPAIAGKVKETTESASKDADFSGLSKAVDKTGGEVKKGLDAAKTTVRTAMSNMESVVKTGGAGMVSAMRSSTSGIADAVGGNMSDALSNVRGYVSSMRSALNTTLKGPHIAVPHFSMSGAFNAQTGTVPTVSVSWYKMGGIFTRPTIFDTKYGLQGVGEAGAEAVLPIDTLKDYIVEAMDSRSTGVTLNLTQYIDGSENPEVWAADFVREVKQQMRIS